MHFGAEFTPAENGPGKRQNCKLQNRGNAGQLLTLNA
jgi:hypothetical protein